MKSVNFDTEKNSFASIVIFPEIFFVIGCPQDLPNLLKIKMHCCYN